jgi:anti-sigma factor RsiW
MTCQELLARYTDYRDGLISAPREARRFTRHLATCAACRRYDAALHSAVGALQSASTAQPTATFRERLEKRLATERVRAGRPSQPSRPALAAALLVAVALGLLAWEGAHRPPETASARPLPPVPFPKPVAQAGLPFVSFQDPRTGVVSGNPYPYGTPFVEPASTLR